MNTPRYITKQHIGFTFAVYNISDGIPRLEMIGTLGECFRFTHGE